MTDPSKTLLGRTLAPVIATREAVAAFPQRLNAWLATLPSTNFQVATSAGLAMTTATVYYVAVLRMINVDSVNFGMWLGFVAAYGGISYKQFAKKRDSINEEMQAKRNEAKP